MSASSGVAMKEFSKLIGINSKVVFCESLCIIFKYRIFIIIFRLSIRVLNFGCVCVSEKIKTKIKVIVILSLWEDSNSNSAIENFTYYLLLI